MADAQLTAMKLTHDRAVHLRDQGYLKLPGAISPAYVDHALRRINNALSEGMPPDLMWKFRSQSYCPEITSSDEIVGLFNNSPARATAEALLGETCKVGSGQIALRFPSLASDPAPPKPHIDGTYGPHNGVPEGTLQSFTALCAVFLSDLPDSNLGNFAVWPGTHLLVAEYAREHGWESLVPGIPPIELPDPVQIVVKTGDVVIAHHLLAHSVAPHIGANVRYACFFRIRHSRHNEHRPEALTDPWLEWPGLRSFFS